MWTARISGLLGLTAMLYAVWMINYVQTKPVINVWKNKLQKSLQEIRMFNSGFKERRRGPIFKTKINRQISKVPSNCQRILLLSRTNYFLYVSPEGSVYGVTEETNESDRIFLLESYGKGIVRLKHEKTKMYVEMDSSTALSAQRNISDYSLFFQRTEENSYDTFASHNFFVEQEHDMFLNINKRRLWKKGRFTHPGQKSSQFLVIFPRSGRTLCD